ncbi:hypothetical protein EDC01DRAFT_618217, partial [Geopyxis carbonaria]
IYSVRSFDNAKSEAIQFHSPLTLIVGYNGSGKTTIIECLKYATTGQLPPNSKGGAFIHDPKMCGEKEVMAQIKLSFNSINEAKMVCTRSLLLTVKKTARQQKTLDGQLLVVRNGERSTISSRCAELDLVMPQYLGVSRAVLDYVIFCHQDESLWPMSEPSVLKKRFDEIFEALKYTKAIDNIKVLRKRQSEELGKLRILLEQYRTDKDRGERAKRRSDELHEEIEEMRFKVEEIGNEMVAINQEQVALFETAKGFEKTLATLQMKKQEAISKKAHISEIEDHMTFLSESNKELQSMQAEYAARMETYQDHIDEKRQAYIEIQNKLDLARSSLNNKLTEQGQIQAEKTAYEDFLRERQSLVRDLSMKHGVNGFDGDLNDDQIHQFIYKLAEMTREQNQILDRIKLENERRIGIARQEYNTVVQQRSSLEQKREYAQSQIKVLDRDCKVQERAFSKIDVDEDREIMIKEDLEKKETELELAKAAFERANFDQKISLEKDRLRQVNSKVDAVTEELIQGSKRASDRAQLSMLQQNTENKRKMMSTIIGTKRDKLNKIIGSNWSAKTAKHDLQSLLELEHQTPPTCPSLISTRQHDEELQEAIQLRDHTAQKLSQIKTKIKMSTDSKATIVDYPKAVSDLEEIRASLKQGEFLRNYLVEAIKFAESKDHCVLCRRGLQNEKQKIITDLKAKLQNLLERVGEQYIQDVDADLQDLRKAGASYDSFMRLTNTEIPMLQRDLEAHKSEKESLLELHDKHDQIVRVCTNKKAEVQTLQGPASDMSNYMREIEESEQQINDLKSAMAVIGVARTVEEIQKDNKQWKEEANAVTNRISELESGKEHERQSIILLDRQISDIRRRLNDTMLMLVESRSIRGKIEDYQQKKQAQLKILQQIDTEINELAPIILTAQAKLNEASDEAAEKERRQQRESNKLAQSDLNIQSIQQRIQKYIDQGGLERLERCKQEVNHLERMVESTSTNMKNIGDDVNRLEKESSSAGAIGQSIAENLRYRKNKQELDGILQEIEDLERQNVGAKRAHFERDAKALSDKALLLSSEKSALVGEMKSKDKQLEQLIQDFATDYADAKDKYKETLAKVQTTTSATNDLGKYGAALDKAVMKYHTLKMEEINRIIEELWKATYRGTDVDTILIRSDNETTRGNRSYNYRVCMVKQDAEMDMRGRCSAGQRVLACIIIRLALAECFGINCGLIALDEPTTNLDSDNIRSLAKSLHGIIETRQAQSNFQLIVITHDEDFLKEMQCQDYCDHYYRVSRNDRQKSVIERQSIAEVI